MHTLDSTEQTRRKRKGQTLAEFALTLPILLVLMFGIIEFARIFQAWVTLQNAARAAARYASVGEYDEAKYPILLGNDLSTAPLYSDPDSIIPCVDDGPAADDRQYGATDQRGTAMDYYPNNPADSTDRMQIYTGGLESAFASWYGGLNCDPRQPEHQEMRKDMLRILSIMEEARKGAAGLLLEESHLAITGDKTDIRNWPLSEVWQRPLPRSDQRSWFNVMVCSTRGVLDDKTNRYFQRELTDPPGVRVDLEERFVTYDGEDILIKQYDPGAGTEVDAPSPACLLNEIPTQQTLDAGGTNNAGKPWLDAGGPANTVTVILTFNHPLITPLGLTNYITMQARRSAIVESFRAGEAVQVLYTGPVLSLDPTNTPFPTLTPSETSTPIPTATQTLPPSVTPTETGIPPFDCGLLSVSNLRIQGNQVLFDISNANGKPSVMTRLIFGWNTIASFPNMNVYEMTMNSIPFWRGQDFGPPTDTNADPSTPPNYFVNTAPDDRTVYANDMSTVAGKFSNSPGILTQYLTIYDFGGTQVYMENPDDLSTCVIPISLPAPTIVPTDDPNAPTATPTYTPDCASDLMSVRFSRFESFGLVRLEVVNNRYAVGPWTDFEVNWRKWSSNITLARVTAYAPQGQPGSVTVWESGSVLQDDTPPTNGHTEGNWVSNYTFDQRSITPIYLDFDGYPSTLSSIGAIPSDFNGSWFEIGCGADGGGDGGGGGGGDSGRIPLSSIPTPAPTNTPGPTRTPAPTYTPSKTFTPSPTSPPPTVGPTKTPTNTPPPTATYTPTTPPPPPTDPGGGSAD